MRVTGHVALAVVDLDDAAKAGSGASKQHDPCGHRANRAAALTGEIHTHVPAARARERVDAPPEGG